MKSGQLRGYAGDVWNVQPAPKDHPWRYMKNPLGGGNGMVPHYSGTTLDAQKRYADGTKDILENYFNNKPQTPANIIVGKSECRSYLYDPSPLADSLRQRDTRPSLTASGKAYRPVCVGIIGAADFCARLVNEPIARLTSIVIPHPH